MRRKRLAVGLVVLALAAVAAATLMLSRPPQLEERAGRMRVGMTRAEVYVVLGALPGDHTRYVTYSRRGGIRRSDSSTDEWDWDEGCVEVRFGLDGRVEDVAFYQND